jgi:hypothetical protein
MSFPNAIAVLLAAALAAGPVLGADPKHDHVPKYGGVVVERGDLDLELVAKAEVIALYVSDHGKPAETKGGTATVTLHSGESKTTVNLEPAGGNKFEAKGAFKLDPGTRAVTTLSLAGKKPVTVRFALK